MQTFNLVKSLYEPLELPITNGEIGLVNDHSGTVEIRELSQGNINDVLRIRLTGNNGTPNVYLGTEGSATVLPGEGNSNFPRNIPLDEIAVLSWNGSAWLLTWE